MALWLNATTNKIWDDANGAALKYPNWPSGMTEVTVAQADLIRNPLPTLAQAQQAQINALKTSYQTAINVPVSFKNAAGVTSTYPAGLTISLNGQTAMQNLNNVLVAGVTAWTLGKWLDCFDVAQTFTFTDLQGLAAAMEGVQTLDWQDLIAKVAEVNMATTVSAVQAITF